MFRNYLKVAFRTLWKNRTHTLINIIGLSVAFGTCVLLFLTATFELSYDRFNADADRIFRLYFFVVEPDGSSEKSATMPYPISTALKAEFPEIEVLRAGLTGVQASAGTIMFTTKTCGWPMPISCLCFRYQ